MATNQLKHAYQVAQKRPPKDQDMIAKQILEAIEEQEWDEIVNHPPRSCRKFVSLLTRH